jgi:hypothetical protein
MTEEEVGSQVVEAVAEQSHSVEAAAAGQTVHEFIDRAKSLGSERLDLESSNEILRFGEESPGVWSIEHEVFSDERGLDVTRVSTNGDQFWIEKRHQRDDSHRALRITTDEEGKLIGDLYFHNVAGDQVNEPRELDEESINKVVPAVLHDIDSQLKSCEEMRLSGLAAQVDEILGPTQWRDED